MSRILIDVAAYMRMSDDSQTASIPAQREAIHRYAEQHGYRVIVEYCDEGISGDATEKRIQFQKMIADAKTGRFKIILVWDISRLGRFDSLEGGYWLWPLRQAGVVVETLDRGKIDWNDFGGRIVWSVEQEAKHGYLRSLSRDTTRGMLKRVNSGKGMNNRPAYGYKAGADGVPIIDQDAAPILRRIYREYLAGKSLRSICSQLTTEGIVGKNGAPWGANTILGILRNPTYTGKFVWGRQIAGKYHHVSGGEIVPTVGVNRRRRTRKAESEWIIIEDHHEPLVSMKDFDAVQKRLKLNKRRSTPLKNGGRFVLSGLLRCGYCGGPMAGQACGGRGRLRYNCQNHLSRGKSFCNLNTVFQDDVVELVFERLEAVIFNDESIAAIRKEFRQLRKQQDTKGQAADLNRRLQATEAKMASLKIRLGEVDLEFVNVIQGQLRDAQADRANLLAQMAGCKKPAPEPDRQIEQEFTQFAKIKEAAETKLETAAVDIREYLLVLLESVIIMAVRKEKPNWPRWAIDDGSINLAENHALTCTAQEPGTNRLEIDLRGNKCG